MLPESAKGAGSIPARWLRRLTGLPLLIPYYHVVGDRHLPHVSHLYRFRTTQEFTADVEFLLRHFQPVELNDVVDMLTERREPPRPYFHLTFDDGFREMYAVVAPLLERFGVPATFFLNSAFLDEGGLAHHNKLSVLLERIRELDSNRTSPVLQHLESLLPKPDGATLKERILRLRYQDAPIVQALAEALEVDFTEYVRNAKPYLSSGQIRSMHERGFTFGAHSHDHPLYRDLSLHDQLGQTRECIYLLKEQHGIESRAFAFPHTDTGVDNRFFDRVFEEKWLDVSFGTGGLTRHFHPRNLERFSMEKTSAPAARILLKQIARGIRSHLARPAL